MIHPDSDVYKRQLMRGSKLPIVKAKVGPQIMSLVCDEKIFDIVPVKKEVKATVSGIYLTGVRAVHGTLPQPANKMCIRDRARPSQHIGVTHKLAGILCDITSAGPGGRGHRLRAAFGGGNRSRTAAG